MRTIAPIITLLLLLIGLANSPAAVAEASAGSTAPVAIEVDDFCGTPPPVSVSCPETGLNECRCYLSSSQTTVEFLTFEPPSAPTKASKPTRAVNVLPPTAPPEMSGRLLADLIERPPQ